MAIDVELERPRSNRRRVARSLRRACIIGLYDLARERRRGPADPTNVFGRLEARSRFRSEDERTVRELLFTDEARARRHTADDLDAGFGLELHRDLRRARAALVRTGSEEHGGQPRQSHRARGYPTRNRDAVRQ